MSARTRLITTAYGRVRNYGPEDVLTWWTLVVNASQQLSPSDLAELESWEQTRGELSTSDWPGWADYIDLPTFWPWEWMPGERHEVEPPSPKQKRGPAALAPKERRFPDAPDKGFHLYRLWSVDGRLLYVGVSVNLRSRLATHAKRFGDLLDHATWDEHADAEAMLAAEAEAIQAEFPRLNWVGV